MKNPANKTLFKDERIINNFYGREKTKTQVKRFHYVHYVMKYKLVTPLLRLFERWFTKRIGMPDLNKPQFKYIKVFNTAFDNTSVDWDFMYLNGIKPKNKRISKRECKRRMKAGTHSHRYLQIMKKMAVALFANDDAYAEWLAIFQWNYYKEIQKSFPDKTVHHIMRTVRHEMDPEYEVVYLQLQQLKHFNLQQLKQ